MPFCRCLLAQTVDLFVKRRWHGWILMPYWPRMRCYQRALRLCRKYKALPAGGRYFAPASRLFKSSNGPCPYAVTAFYMAPGRRGAQRA